MQNKWLVIVIFLTVLFLLGCGNNNDDPLQDSSGVAGTGLTDSNSAMPPEDRRHSDSFQLSGSTSRSLARSAESELEERRAAAQVLPPLMTSSQTHFSSQDKIHIEFELLTYSPKEDLSLGVALYTENVEDFKSATIPVENVTHSGFGTFSLSNGRVKQNKIKVSYDLSLSSSDQQWIEDGVYFRVFIVNNSIQDALGTVNGFEWPGSYFTVYVPQILGEQLHYSNSHYSRDNDQDNAQRYLWVSLPDFLHAPESTASQKRQALPVAPRLQTFSKMPQSSSTTSRQISTLRSASGDLEERRAAARVLSPLLTSTNSYRLDEKKLHLEFEVLTYSPKEDLSFWVEFYDSDLESIADHLVSADQVSFNGLGTFDLHDNGSVKQNKFKISFNRTFTAAQWERLKPTMHYRVYIKNSHIQDSLGNAGGRSWNTSYFTMYAPKLLNKQRHYANSHQTAFDQDKAQRYIKLDLTARPQFAYLFIHGINSGASTWDELVTLNEGGDNPFVNDRFPDGCPVIRIRDSDAVLEEKAVFQRNPDLCYRIQFGRHTRTGLEGIQEMPLDGPYLVSENFHLGDAATFNELGHSVHLTVDKIIEEHVGTKVILVGHSRGGLAARSFLQVPELSAARDSVAGLLTIGTPHLGSPLGKIYQWLSEDEHKRDLCKSEETPNVDNCYLDWKMVEFLLSPRTSIGTAKPTLDVRAPTVFDLQTGSGSLNRLNSNVHYLPKDIVYGSLIYTGSNLGVLSRTATDYSVFDVPGNDDLIGDQASPCATQYVFEGHTLNCENYSLTRETLADFQGDGIVPEDSQNMISIPNFPMLEGEHSAFLYRTVENSQILHAGEVTRHEEILDMIEWMEDSYLPPSDPPWRPSNLTARSEDQTTLVVNWDKVDSATSYSLYQAPSASGNYTIVETSPSIRNTIKDLTCGTTYYFKVKANNGAGSSDFSVATSAPTDACTIDAIVNSVSPLSATAGETTTFTIQGSNFGPNLAFWISTCEGLTELSGGSETTRQFRCTPNSAGNKAGEVKDAPGGQLLKSFTLAVSVPSPVVDSVSPLSATVDVSTIFTVQGSNLVSGMDFWLQDCSNVVELSGGNASQLRFQCTPSSTGIKSGGVRLTPQSSFLKEFNVTINAMAPDRIEIIGLDEIPESSIVTYSAKAFYPNNTSQTINASWEASGASVSLNGGEVTTPSVSSDQNFTLTARYAGKTDSKTITITNSPPVPTSLSISSGNSQIDEHSTVYYSATLHYNDNSTRNVTNSASWSTNNSYAQAYSGGRVVTTSLTSTRSFTLRAEYAGFTATKGVDIRPVADPDYITITGDSQIDENTSKNYIARLYYDTGSHTNITLTATWSTSNSNASVNRGYVSANNVSSNRTFSVRVSHSGLSHSKSVTVVDTGDVISVNPENSWVCNSDDWRIANDDANLCLKVNMVNNERIDVDFAKDNGGYFQNDYNINLKVYSSGRCLRFSQNNDCLNTGTRNDSMPVVTINPNSSYNSPLLQDGDRIYIEVESPKGSGAFYKTGTVVINKQ